MGADAVFWAENEHTLEQVDAKLVDLGEYNTKVLSCVHLEAWLVLGELCDAWPRTFGWRAHDTKDTGDLVFIGCAWEQGPTSVHLGHDTTS